MNPENGERSPNLALRVFPADGVIWLVAMPEGMPSETMWPVFVPVDGGEDDCVCACCHCHEADADFAEDDE